jgi:hypothetical protein
MQTPSALSFAEGCAQSSRVNVLPMYASARRFFARLASEIFLSGLQSGFFSLGGKNFSDPQIPGAAEPEQNLGISPAKHVLSDVEGARRRKGRSLGIDSVYKIITLLL